MRAARECCVALDAVTRDDPGSAQTLLAAWAPHGPEGAHRWARAAERARDDDREAARRGLDQAGHFKRATPQR